MHHIKATITKRNGRIRDGQGFSQKELKEAGINKQDAQQMNIRLDMRRRTCHQSNIDTIKAHKPQPKA
jgi:large subunit ribosomal protein L13e